MGNVEVIDRGGIQMTSAGSGIIHSEKNEHPTTPVHMLQIWVKPNQMGITPRYQTVKITDEEKMNKLRLVVSPKGTDGSALINQDFNMYSTILGSEKTVEHQIPKGKKNRRAFVHVIKKSDVSVKLIVEPAKGETQEQLLKGGDAAFIERLNEFDIVKLVGQSTQGAAETILMELA